MSWHCIVIDVPDSKLLRRRCIKLRVYSIQADEEMFNFFFKCQGFKKDFLYLFMRERERERERQRLRQREKQAPCREPDVGLNPRTLGSRSELKADAQPLSHPGIPEMFNLL